MRKNVTQTILKIIKDKLELVDSEIVPVINNTNTNLIDIINFDSLDEIEIIMDIEKEFGIFIRDDDAEKIMATNPLTIITIYTFLKDKYGLIDIKDERKNKINEINGKK
jgi:acyl carrier protein